LAPASVQDLPDSVRGAPASIGGYSPTSIGGLPLHTRSLTVSLRAAANGRWLARGDVIDLRKNGFVPTSYDIQPAGVIHSMSIELDLDPTSLCMEAIRVEQPFIAVESSEATRGECCRDPAPRLLELAGECLDDAFPAKLSAKFGGPLGCSHLLTLFQLMASALPHAAEFERARSERDGTRHAEGDRFFRRAVFVDGMRREDGRIDVAVALSDSMTRPYSPGTHSLTRVERFHEVKIAATVDRKRFGFDALEILERIRDADSLESVEWNDRSATFDSFVDSPVLPGLAKRIFGLTGDDPSLRAIQDALLMFAPGFIQVIAAQMDLYFEERARAQEQGTEPEVARLGGNPGACYMWREGGPSMSLRETLESRGRGEDESR